MNKLKSIWQIEDLRKKILFTLLLILVFRLGCSIPVPFVSNTALDSMFSNDSIFGYMNMLSGGALSRCAFFALGVSPYINSSIITQLLCVALPSWEALQKETTGKDKLDEYTKRIALAMAAIMSIGYYFVLRNYGALEYTAGKSGFFAAVVIMATFLAGSQLSVWIGGRIDEFGIGNGVSILIFASIVSSVPNVVINLINGTFHIIPTTNGLAYKWWYGIVVILVVLILTVGIVTVEKAVRRIPVQYAKRVVGRKLYGGQSTHIPLKANANGVMPLIFAMTILQVPGMIGQFWPKGKFNTFVSTYLSPATTNIAGIIIYYVLYAIMIVGFAYFYSSITFNPVEISKNLQQNGGFIPGIRPGRPTSDYLQKKCSRLTMFGALFLMIIAIIPTLLLKVLNITVLSAFGPTSILIMISVSIEIADQLDSLMIMRNHKGFLN